MSSSAIDELEAELESIARLNSWEPCARAADAMDLSIATRDVLPIKSDFATMGGGRPRQMD